MIAYLISISRSSAYRLVKKYHIANVVRKWLKDQEIQLLEIWPRSSLDLNPIENCWTIVKKAVTAKNPSLMHGHREAIKLAWIQEVTLDNCHCLFGAIPGRVAQVLMNR